MFIYMLDHLSINVSLIDPLEKIVIFMKDVVTKIGK